MPSTPTSYDLGALDGNYNPQYATRQIDGRNNSPRKKNGHHTGKVVMGRTLETGFTSHHKSVEGKTNEWFTPKYIIDALGPFSLDVCTTLTRPWDTADAHFCVEQHDGLVEPWYENYVWCNPPYGKETGKWLQKLRLHNNGIALTFARTETKYFQRWTQGAKGFLFLDKRLVFYNGAGEKAKYNAGAPSVLIAYGEYAWYKLKSSKLKGILMRYE